ncbi:MAG: fibronectin type III domain-containing protein [Bacteroidia bacterium]
MNTKKIAVLKISGNPVLIIIEKVRKVILMMTGNVTYTTPVPPLAQLTTETDDVETNYQDSLKGDRDKKALMRIALATLKDSLRTLTGYVQSASEGDETKILSAGFDVKSPRNPVGILPPPGNVRCVFGNVPGEIIVRWGGVKGRLIYKVQINETPDIPRWVDYTYTGKARLVVSGLVSGNVYEFRIACISASGIGDYSDPASHKAL